jgi:hypothetical protein
MFSCPALRLTFVFAEYAKSRLRENTDVVEDLGRCHRCCYLAFSSPTDGPKGPIRWASFFALTPYGQLFGLCDGCLAICGVTNHPVCDDALCLQKCGRPRCALDCKDCLEARKQDLSHVCKLPRNWQQFQHVDSVKKQVLCPYECKVLGHDTEAVFQSYFHDRCPELPTATDNAHIDIYLCGDELIAEMIKNLESAALNMRSKDDQKARTSDPHLDYLRLGLRHVSTRLAKVSSHCSWCRQYKRVCVICSDDIPTTGSVYFSEQLKTHDDMPLLVCSKRNCIHWFFRRIPVLLYTNADNPHIESRFCDCAVTGLNEDSDSDDAVEKGPPSDPGEGDVKDTDLSNEEEYL